MMINWRNPKKELPYIKNGGISSAFCLVITEYINKYGELKESVRFSRYRLDIKGWTKTRSVKAWCYAHELLLTVPEELRGNDG